jgi:AraC-like DNA-binding protein
LYYAVLPAGAERVQRYMDISQSHTKTATHYVGVLMRHARRLGLNVDGILADTEIPCELAESENDWIDNRLVTALVKRMWQETQDETFGLAPTQLRIGTWALACELMLNGETLGGLYRKGEHALSYLASQSLGVSMIGQDDTVSIIPSVYIGAKDPDRFLSEFIMVVWHRFPSWAIDENIRVNDAFFSYPRPPHGHLYEEFFQCEVTFDQPQTGFSFSRKYLNKKISRSGSELNAWLRDSPADLLYMPGRETSVYSHFMTSLRKQLEEDQRFSSFEFLCSHLNMSPQVVRRRLAEEGTSYQQIKDSVRLELAKTLLANSELPMIDIAERTGFTESAAFSRAFKKWTGSSPANYRTEKKTVQQR